MTKKVSFVGTGLMGFPMARNLLKSKTDLKVYNRTLEKAEPLIKFGAKISSSLEEVVENTDVIITMLTDDEAVKIVLNDKKLLKNLKPNSTVIDMSSTNPEIAINNSKKLKEFNVNFLDAPVSGGTIGAEKATLAIMVGGDLDVFEKVDDILKMMGNPTLVGQVGSGQISKLANQIIVGISIGAVAEAITLCEKTGVDVNKFLMALKGGFADSKILQTHGQRMIKKDFSPGGKVSTHFKDMNNIIKCAKKIDIDLPISNLIEKMFESLIKEGNANDDHSALYKEIQRINQK